MVEGYGRGGVRRTCPGLLPQLLTLLNLLPVNSLQEDTYVDIDTVFIELRDVEYPYVSYLGSSCLEGDRP